MLMLSRTSRDGERTKRHYNLKNQVVNSLNRTAIFIVSWLQSKYPSHFPVAIKLAIYISLLITTGMSLLGFVIIHNQTILLNQQIHSSGRTIVEQMAISAREPLLATDTLLLDVLVANLATREDILGTSIYSVDKKIISSSGNSPFEVNAPFHGDERFYLQDGLKTLQWKWPFSPNGSLDSISFISPVKFKDVIVGYAVISFSREAMTRSIEHSVRSVVSATVLLIMLGIMMSYIVGRRLSRPLQHLIHASKEISLGRYNYRIHENRNDEIGDLIRALNTTARNLENKCNLAAQGIRQKRRIANAFSRHVPSNVTKEILDNLDEIKLGGKQVFASVMFVDIVGFTRKSETMRPTEVADLLNEFYSRITETCSLYKGTIDKFIGDSAMLLFGIPEEDVAHVFHSIAYGVFFQSLMKRLNPVRAKQGKFPIYFRIGVNTGEMLAGYIGSRERLQYTVVGDTVNLASRLCSLAVEEQVIISEETYNLPGIRDKVIASRHKSIRVRGKSQPVNTYLVHDVKEFYKDAMDRQIENILQSSTGI